MRSSLPVKKEKCLKKLFGNNSFLLQFVYLADVAERVDLIKDKATLCDVKFTRFFLKVQSKIRKTLEVKNDFYQNIAQNVSHLFRLNVEISLRNSISQMLIWLPD